MKKRMQRGQAMVEYMSMVGLVLATMFLPVFPNPDGGGNLSIVMLFAKAYDIYINSFHFVITLPIP